jgi:competence protein ComEA
MKKIALLAATLLAYCGMAFAVVNINSASQKQLEELPGVGPAKAKAIIDYRKKNGPFKSVEDIKKVDGIGEATYEKIKGDLVLSGTTTGVGKPAEKKDGDKAAKPDAKSKGSKKDEKK